MSPAVVWDYLSSPVFRNILMGTQKQEIKDLVGGRIGVGTAYQCYHGSRVTPQKIIEWEPFTKIVTEDGTPDSLMGTTLVVYHLEETSSGTHLRAELGGHEGRSRWVRAILKAAAFVVVRIQTRALNDFVDAVTADHLQRSGPGATSPVVS